MQKAIIQTKRKKSKKGQIKSKNLIEANINFFKKQCILARNITLFQGLHSIS